jgi:DNA-binding transcriptional MerR regulator
MSTLDQKPTFNLKAVLQETGLKADTLRAWERRYGLPRPERTAGGHRLYSQRDIDTIKWLAARQGEGMRISQAVDLWHNLETDRQDPLQVMEFTTSGAAPAPISLPEGETMAELRQAWASACLAFDEPKVNQVQALAYALFPVEAVCLELLQKGLAELGQGWYRGEVTVQQEHFASEMVVRRLEALVAATPPSTRPERILIACPPQEEHTVSALLLTLLLRRRGWDVLYLGANVPVGRLEEAIATVGPKLVILPAQQLHTAATTLPMGRLLQAQGIPLAFGGRVFNLLPELRTRIPGHFLGESLDVTPQMVREILPAPPPLPPVQSASHAYQQALAHYRERQALIEAQMWQTMKPDGIRLDHLNIANTHLELNLKAALALGELDLLKADVDWVAGLVSHHRLPGNLVPRYLNAYHQAAETHLDERGAPVITYLAQLSRGKAFPEGRAP